MSGALALAVAAIGDLRHFAAAFTLLFASLFLVAGAVGQSRFPDFYTRLHALAPIAGLGGLLLLAALALESWDGRLTIRLALLGGVLVFIGPAIAHMLAAAAHAHGLAPLVGKPRGRGEG